jgi:hypothetical protein
VGLTTEVGPVVSDGASRVVRCCTASCGTVDKQIDKQPVADGPPRRAVDRVAALNSIPDCTTSLFALVLLVAFATRIRHKMIRKMINWLKKGAVIKMVRKVIAGPWWASACALGATALTTYGESGLSAAADTWAQARSRGRMSPMYAGKCYDRRCATQRKLERRQQVFDGNGERGGGAE